MAGRIQDYASVGDMHTLMSGGACQGKSIQTAML